MISTLPQTPGSNTRSTGLSPTVWNAMLMPSSVVAYRLTEISRSAHYPVQVPPVGDALQVVIAGVLEHKARPGDEILHRLRHEYL